MLYEPKAGLGCLVPSSVLDNTLTLRFRPAAHLFSCNKIRSKSRNPSLPQVGFAESYPYCNLYLILLHVAGASTGCSHHALPAGQNCGPGICTQNRASVKCRRIQCMFLVNGSNRAGPTKTRTARVGFFTEAQFCLCSCGPLLPPYTCTSEV